MAVIFNRITVKPQLPKNISKLYDISYNLWWTWNTEYLKLFKDMDGDLWEECNKNPIIFLNKISQEKLEKASNNSEFLKQYNSVVKHYEDYMQSKNNWFQKKYPNNVNDKIAYFSAEYGLDETVPIYSGGLGILSGDHLKSASDLGIPLTGIGMLYKNGYFNQIINGRGEQETEYRSIDISTLPLKPVKFAKDKDLIINIKIGKKKLYLKIWKIEIGRVNLYLMDSDIDENSEDFRNITTTLYGGDQDMRIKQEMVLGMGGITLLNTLGIEPTVYHMNEGHSSFLTIELIKSLMQNKQVSFEIAKDIVSSKTVFTTHTPVPAGNDIFPVSLVEKYFDKYWDQLGITKEEFLKLGIQTNGKLEDGFNMGVLALKIAGKKNGVSKLHGEVSRKLFQDVWTDVPANESPIDYVTNGVHTCFWLAPTIKDLYNSYFKPYWQDSIQYDDTWKEIYKIPDEKLWEVHQERKAKLLKIVKDSTTERLRKYNYSYDLIDELVGNLEKDTDVLTIGFARRFATYKRATLIFRDIERITKIFNEIDKPVRFIIAGKAHPIDKEGQGLIKYIHDLSLKPQFKGKIFILENYNIGMSRYLISGVDVWLNNPRRPLEASGTSGQKAAINGVINFSVLDGWWAEGYNQENGWTIGTHQEFDDYEEQDEADSKSLYDTLENKIIPMYYDKNKNGYSERWLKVMKNSISSNAGRYSTARMLEDYTEKEYIPLCNLYNKFYYEIDNVSYFNEWKSNVKKLFSNIKIVQNKDNSNDVTIDAGNTISVGCKVELPSELLKIRNVEMQVYYGKMTDKGIVDDIQIITMDYDGEEKGKHNFSAKIGLRSGGDYGYTFRAIPKNEMLLNSMDLNVIKWMDE